MDALVTGGPGSSAPISSASFSPMAAPCAVLARAGSDRRGLAGCRVEIAEGDLLDRDSLRAAVAGARRVYHVAADLPAVGPRLARALSRQCRRHAPRPRGGPGGGRGRANRVHVHRGRVGHSPGRHAGDETTAVGLEDMVGPYKASKFLAERVADELAARGAPVVIVNPSGPPGALGHQADAHGADDRGLPQGQDGGARSTPG